MATHAIPTPPTAGTPVEAAIPVGLASEIKPVGMAPKPELVPPTPPKELSTKQEINKAIEETAEMLLQLRDKRIELAALARQAGEGEMTPLGDELRQSFVKNILNDPKLDETVKTPLTRLKLPEQKTKRGNGTISSEAQRNNASGSSVTPHVGTQSWACNNGRTRANDAKLYTASGRVSS